MSVVYNREFEKLSAESRFCLQTGNLSGYSSVLKKMADIHNREFMPINAAKALMVAFYVDLSAVDATPHIDERAMSLLIQSVIMSGMDIYKAGELFKEVVRSDTTPSHIFTVSDCLYLMELCLTGNKEEADRILEKRCGMRHE